LARQFPAAKGIDADAIAPQVDGWFVSAFIRAKKPNGSAGISNRPTITISGTGMSNPLASARVY